ncbi:MAG: twin-arginine translocase TatA/TatE family subunit [Phycisphaeraceae bacterium]|nr:twin-arginine translocase TatA/TatE family subunit [Phycisphaeraceae bacterium]
MHAYARKQVAIMFNVGPWELVILAVLGLLIFGKRLPEVGRSLGKSVVEFKKGLSGIEDEVKQAGESSAPSDQPDRPSAKP